MMALPARFANSQKSNTVVALWQTSANQINRIARKFDTQIGKLDSSDCGMIGLIATMAPGVAMIGGALAIDLSFNENFNFTKEVMTNPTLINYGFAAMAGAAPIGIGFGLPDIFKMPKGVIKNNRRVNYAALALPAIATACVFAIFQHMDYVAAAKEVGPAQRPSATQFLQAFSQPKP